MAENTAGVVKNKTSGMGIRNKLLLWLLLIALVPLLLIGAVAYQSSSKALEKQSFSSLETTRKLQQKSLQDFFVQRSENLQDLNDAINMMQQKIYDRITSIRDLKHRELLEFLNQHIKLARIFSASPQQKSAYPLFSNPATPLAAKKRFIKFYNNWMGQHEFASLILIDKSGRVLYSNDKFIKEGLSITANKKAPEFKAYTDGLKKPSFTDFSASPLRNNEINAYFSAPMMVDKQVKGTFLFRLTTEMLNGIIKGDVGLEDEGDIYLVGPDRMFRSNSSYFEENVVVNPAFLVDTEPVDAAIDGKSGASSIVDFRGEYVYSAYRPVDFAGVRWAMLVELDQTLAMAARMEGSDEDFLTSFLKTYGLYDIFLITNDGFIFYSVTHKEDYQTNILTGPFADSGLGEAVKSVMANKEMAVSDFQLYQPSDNLPASFMATPLLSDNEVEMVVAIQLYVDPIDSLMKEFGGEGTGGDAYLVGQDKLFRSDSLQTESYNVKSTMLNPKVKADSEPVRQALAGKSGTGITTNPAGQTVLASWAPFNFHGVRWALVNEIDKDVVFQSITKLLTLLVTITAASVAGVLFLSFFVTGGMTKQIDEIMKVIGNVEEGDLESEAKVISTDELGTMASSFNTMVSNTKNLIQERQVEHDQLQDSIMGLLMEISDLAEGDLTVRATVREDATGTVADSLNMMLEELSTAIGKIKQSSEQVGTTANRLSTDTGDLAIQNDSQAELLSGALEEISRITEAIEEAASKANKSAATSELSMQAATEGTKAVEDTSTAMDAIRSNVQDTARAIKRLGESSQEISDFAKTINEISDRTSILALNASIQASAAGEEGRGFAVVAEEIQRLAERAAASTRQIETLIKNILGEITDAGMSMDASIQEVVRGTTLSEDALTKLQDINKRSSEVADLISDVSQATGEQAESSVKIARTMEEIGGISKVNAEETRKTSASMQEMAEIAGDMLESVSVFKLPEGDSDAGKGTMEG